MMKKIVWGVGGALVLAVLLFGGKTVVSYAATGKRLLMSEAQARIPFGVEVERLRTVVGGLDDTVLRHEKKLVEQEVELEHLEREVTSRRDDLARAESTLTEVRALLSEPEPVYVIHGRSYRLEEVQRDAIARVDAYQSAKNVLEVRDATLHTLREAVNLGRRQIQEARHKRQQYEGMITRLQAENVKVQAKKELAASIGRLRLDESVGDFEAAQGLYERLKKRLEVENRMIDARLAQPLDGIRYGVGAEVTRDPLREIDAVLRAEPAQPDADLAIDAGEERIMSMDLAQAPATGLSEIR